MFLLKADSQDMAGATAPAMFILELLRLSSLPGQR